MGITKVWIDESENECTMCGVCEAVCDSVFEVPEKMVVKDGINFDDYADEVQEAIDSCPVEVIKMETSEYIEDIEFINIETETDRLFEFIENLFQECLNTMKKKNNDYSGDNKDDPMKNFNLSAEVVGITPEQGMLIRTMDKLNRLGTAFSGIDLQVSDESEMDTIKDGIGYLALTAFRRHQRRQDESED